MGPLCLGLFRRRWRPNTRPPSSSTPSIGLSPISLSSLLISGVVFWLWFRWFDLVISIGFGCLGRVFCYLNQNLVGVGL